MSNKPLANPNAFTGQPPPWSLTQLDANFTALQNTINDTLTYANYFVDQSGVANSIVISIPPALVVAATAGTLLYIKINNTNTAAVTITVNALPAQTVVNPDLTALSPSQCLVGQIGIFIYDGTRYQLLGAYVGPAFGRSTAEVTAGVVPTLYAYPPGNILRYGGVGDGATNNYTAFQQAVAVCSRTGLTLVVPSGNFKIDTTSGTLNLSYLTMLGTGVTNGSATPTNAGSVISIIGTANSPFTLGPGVTFDGIVFFYPAQVDSFTPIVFPPTIVTSLAIAGAINFVYIQNCTVFNAYRFFVDTDATGALGHVFVDNCTIYGILTCFEIAYNAEIITFTGNEFTFGHYLAATEAGLRKYTRLNGQAIVFVRTDGFSFNSNVIFGYSVGIYFNTGTSATLCQLTSITQNYFDQVLQCVLASGNGNVSGLTITANSFVSFNSQNTSAVANAVVISTTGAGTAEVIAISANNFSTCTNNQIFVSGAANRSLSITGNVLTSWGAYQTVGSFGALNISGASTSYVASGNYILSQASTPAVATGILGSAVDAAINGNIFGLCQAAINATFTVVTLNGNISYSTSGATSDLFPSSGSVLQVNNSWDKASGTTTRPMVEVVIAVAQTFSSASYTAANFGTIVYDLAGNWSGANTFTAKQKGRYRFEWSLAHDASGTAGDVWNIALVSSAGVNKAITITMIASSNSVVGAADVLMSNADTVQLQVKRASGTGNFVEINDATLSYLCASLIE